MLRVTLAWHELEADLRRSFAKPGVPADVVDDLVQEAALRLMKGLPTLRGPDRLGPYVGRVVRSVWVDHLRRRRPVEPLPADLAADAPPLEDESLTQEVASWLPRFVEGLEEPYREALRLVELQGRSQREVADALGLSASGARTRVQRGRKKLREALQRCCRIVREGARVTAVHGRDGCCDEPSDVG
ncbi:MAG: sigma-70 family RNA polymerase sigma factor [Myxococcales bacterium]|nr:sigma-70 family RNA polymerase sigma factor [Myxococcales bacterium]